MTFPPGRRGRRGWAVPSALALVVALASPAGAGRTDGIDPSLLVPGLVQARDAVARLERLTDEAEAIGTALFRVHNRLGEKREAETAATDCTTPWLGDLGTRARELGRAFRDAVQSARVQGRRVESLGVQATVAPLLDPETNHRITSLLARVDDLVRRYPEAASWQERYVEPLLEGCMPYLVPAPGLPDPAPPAHGEGRAAVSSNPLQAKKPQLVAVIAIGGGFLCPGAEPAAGVMLVSGAVCYSTSEACDCEPATVSPATVLGPETKAGSAN